MSGIIDKNRRAYERDVTRGRRTHTGRSQRIQLFKAESQTGLVRTKEIGFANERQMQELVEHNIGTLFSGLTFLKTEFRDMTEGERRPDTMAFDAYENTFVVIEYKNKQDNGVVTQAKAYLKDMRDHKGDLLVEYSKKMNCSVPDKKSFRWDAMYTIIIAPKFDGFQIPAADDDVNVELYEIRMYNDNAIILDRVGGAHVRQGLPTPSDLSESTDDPRGSDYIPKLYETLCKRLQDEFPRMGVDNKPKSFVGFGLPGSKYFCKMIIQKGKILLFLTGRINPEQYESGFVSPNNGLVIRNEADIDKTLTLLKEQHADR